jgi:hypothetical protein
LKWRELGRQRREGNAALQIVLETETPGDSRTMFRLHVDAKLISEGLTAAQAHLLIGEILERIALPAKRAKGSDPMVAE